MRVTVQMEVLVLQSLLLVKLKPIFVHGKVGSNTNRKCSIKASCLWIAQQIVPEAFQMVKSLRKTRLQ